uniref:(California timema) hypothetical protein n=1 Tax=Timema californicum TaxID=61474 RepID=A0A7R9PAL8_TIMCA|nr:unnamed protein product [Timema californicum]
MRNTCRCGGWCILMSALGLLETGYMFRIAPDESSRKPFIRTLTVRCGADRVAANTRIRMTIRMSPEMFGSFRTLFRANHQAVQVGTYSSPMISLVLTDSSQLNADDFETLPYQIMYPYAKPYDLHEHKSAVSAKEAMGLLYIFYSTFGQQRMGGGRGVLFRDETTISAVEENTQYVRRGPGEAFRTDCVVQNLNYPTKVVIWSGISIYGTGHIHIVQGNMNAGQYREGVETSPMASLVLTDGFEKLPDQIM